MKNKLTHVAFIMDGNGRWAKKRGLPRHLGHKAGCDRIIDIYEECLAQDIRVMSLYAFSTENWNRPQDEINHLFEYLDIFFKKEIKRIIIDHITVRGHVDIVVIHVDRRHLVTHIGREISLVTNDMCA